LSGHHAADVIGLCRCRLSSTDEIVEANSDTFGGGVGETSADRALPRERLSGVAIEIRS
jgi:hypothetical protein